MSIEEPSFRFAPLTKIASGGTATVYVGAGRGNPTLVALKRPHAHVLEDERQRAALLREARLAAALRHPNIVVVRFVEESGEHLQLVMDYVEGSALGTLIALAAKKDERLPAGVAVRIVLDACEGLQAVHDHRDEAGRVLGLVHRDVSPQNILVGLDGVAKIADFGLAKAMYEGAPSTTQGTLKGKLGYMAPEYVNRGQLDRTIDVFAMGVVLWEALAGRRLFRGDNEAQTLDRILRAEVPPLREVDPQLSRFDPIVARALAKDPLQRFSSSDALARALEPVAKEAHALATREQVAAYVERAVCGELARRREEVERARVHRGWRNARPLVWGALVTAVVAGSALLLLRFVPGSARAPAGSASSADTAVVAIPATSAAVPSSTPPSASATVPDEAPVTNEIELDPAERSAPSPARPHATNQRQVPPNPYVHRDASRMH
jgi:eukaryotic-like serine/threonine-protein kinase